MAGLADYRPAASGAAPNGCTAVAIRNDEPFGML
jgi:hypothetical protein